jgi:hypothetical protein
MFILQQRMKLIMRRTAMRNWNVHSISALTPEENIVTTFQCQKLVNKISKQTIGNESLHEISIGKGVRGPPPWSSGQISWLQIRRPGFDSCHCHKKK